MLVQCIVAVLVALTGFWFVARHWVPVVTDAIQALPGESVIQNGRWITTDPGPHLLAGNRYLEIILDARDAGGVSGAADLSAVVTVPGLQFCGVLGCVDLPYEPGETIKVSRNELAPWWDAWRQPVEALLSITIFLAVLISWWLLGAIATPIVKLIAFFTDRQVTWGGCWRVGNAALLPGAFIVIFGVVLYAFGVIDPLRLALFYALHIVCDMVFVATSPFFLPKIGAAQPGKNPFATTPPPTEPKTDSAPKETNPFR